MTLSAPSLHPQQQLGANRRVSAPCSCYRRSYMCLSARYCSTLACIWKNNIRAGLFAACQLCSATSLTLSPRSTHAPPPSRLSSRPSFPLPPRPPLLGFIPPSPLRHLSRNQFRPAASHRHGMLAKGDGVRSGFSATTFPLPPDSDLLPPRRRHSRYFAAFPQLARYSSGVARQHDRTALCGVISHTM